MSTKLTTLSGMTALALVTASSGAFAANGTSDNGMADNDADSTSNGSVQAMAQGLYSAERLMDADVYTSGDNQKSIGEVEDVLLGNDMSIRSFVVQTNGKFGFGGKSYVVSPDDLTVKTMKTDHASQPDYRVTINMTGDQLSSQPVYSDSWWQNAQSQAADAWQTTKHSAKNAWTELKSTTSNIVNGGEDQAQDAKQATSNAADNTADAADDAADNTADAADNAGDKVANTADAAKEKTGDAAEKAGDKAEQAGDKADNATNN